jgi:hypothetical protein
MYTETYVQTTRSSGRRGKRKKRSEEIWERTRRFINRINVMSREARRLENREKVEIGYDSTGTNRTIQTHPQAPTKETSPLPPTTPQSEHPHSK